MILFKDRQAIRRWIHAKKMACRLKRTWFKKCDKCGRIFRVSYSFADNDGLWVKRFKHNCKIDE